MRRSFLTGVAVVLLFALPLAAQAPELSKTVQPFVRVRAPKVVLTHVRVIDGTGAPAVPGANEILRMAITPASGVSNTWSSRNHARTPRPLGRSPAVRRRPRLEPLRVRGPAGGPIELRQRPPDRP